MRSSARARASAALALAAGLALAPGRAEGQGTSGVIGVSACVLPAPRPDTIPAARVMSWRTTLPPNEPALVRGALVRTVPVAPDDRRRLVIAYVGT